MEPTFRPPPLPEPEVLPELLQSWSLSKGEELFFVQLPDSLPGQPPTQDARPAKTEVQSEDGQSILLKTESQVGIYKCLKQAVMRARLVCGEQHCIFVSLMSLWNRKSRWRRIVAILGTCRRGSWDGCWCESRVKCSSYWDMSRLM